MVCHCCAGRDVFVCCSKRGKHLLHCSNCGVYYYNERPSEKELSTHYQGQYSIQHKEQLFNILKENFDKGYFKTDAENHLRLLNAPAKTVLDYGSSYGFYLKAMMNLGISAYGVEYDGDIVKYNQTQLGITMINPHELEKKADKSFDIVRVYHTIEHLPEPDLILSLFFRLLTENGILILSTPCISESIVHTNVTKLPDMVFPEHLFYFTLGSLSSLLSKIGFKVEVCISQFATPSQALDILGSKGGKADALTLENLAKGLEGLGAGINSFVVARKPVSVGDTDSERREPYDTDLDHPRNSCVLQIYPVLNGRRGSHHVIKEDGLWEVEFPFKRSSTGGRIFVCGNVIVLNSRDRIRIQLVNSSSYQQEPSEIEVYKDNVTDSFVFYNDVKGEDDYYIRVSGTHDSEFIVYDLNCCEISDPSTR